MPSVIVLPASPLGNKRVCRLQLDRQPPCHKYFWGLPDFVRWGQYCTYNTLLLAFVCWAFWGLCSAGSVLSGSQFNLVPQPAWHRESCGLRHIRALLYPRVLHLRSTSPSCLSSSCTSSSSSLQQRWQRRRQPQLQRQRHLPPQPSPQA